MTGAMPFARLTRRVDLQSNADDPSLPPDTLDRLREVADQVGRLEHDGSGLQRTILFDGSDAAGMAMAAAVVARSLDRDLYRIDLSAVVSRYIGETEKNLRRAFDAATESDAVLFFDEADALFGKRSGVRDSHDRYANVEISYLLERIEAFPGIVILATNAADDLPERLVRSDRPFVRFGRLGRPDPRL